MRPLARWLKRSYSSKKERVEADGVDQAKLESSSESAEVASAHRGSGLGTATSNIGAPLQTSSTTIEADILSSSQIINIDTAPVDDSVVKTALPSVTVQRPTKVVTPTRDLVIRSRDTADSRIGSFQRPTKRAILQNRPTSSSASEVNLSPAATVLGLPDTTSAQHSPIDDVPVVMQRKIWVKRPGASATIVKVNDDDLVDTVRDVILQKYANSLGRSIDSPDINLKIVAREQGNKNVPAERMLGPEETIGRTLDSYYPGGQNIDEALLIEVISQRRTPKPSPRVGNHHAVGFYVYDEHRPSEGAREYFPPMAVHSPHLAAHPLHQVQPNGPHMGPHSMAVLTTGQLPPLPSPGGHPGRRERKPKRPEFIRQHTSSPTIMHTSQPHSNDASKQSLPNGIATQQPIPTPPAQDHRSTITPPRTSSPHPGKSFKRKKQPGPTRSINDEPPPPKLQQSGTLDGNVPPINVLIVEDNPINLRLLEQFMRRLKVRWKTAMNGKEAVNTWRTGGFHLVLMDIQLPVMNGLEATKEIRRLESVNGIGLGLVGGQTVNGAKSEHDIASEDKLTDMNLFKSPVIIVALTASSLQSDRHEALAVGCNDFLTKPVTLPWMLRKVTEWGCMQALIDFEGWRQWKAAVEKKEEGLSEEQKKVKEKEEKAKQKAALKAMFSASPPSRKKEEDRTERKDDKDEKNNETSQPGSRKSSANSATTSSNSSIPRGQRNLRGSSGSQGTMLETHQEENENEE